MIFFTYVLLKDSEPSFLIPDFEFLYVGIDLLQCAFIDFRPAENLYRLDSDPPNSNF